MYFGLNDSKQVPLDKKLDELFNHKEHGVFVELGAHDGLTQSNTAFFEFTRKWSGVLVEPSKSAFDLCVQNRPNSKCYNYACVSDSYTEHQINGDFTGVLMSSVNSSRLNKSASCQVNAIQLEKLLAQSNITHIDFLSLDTEGYELEVLNGLNLIKYRPTYLLIELYSKDFDSVVSYLSKYRYTMVENFSNYNHQDNPIWDGTHNDYLFRKDF